MTRALEVALVCRGAGGAERRVRLAAALDAAAVERAHVEANAWIKSLRHAEVDGTSMRDRFRYRGDSLWWFTELFLHRAAQVTLWHAATAAMRAIVAREAPRAIALDTSHHALGVIAREIARSSGITYDDGVGAPRWQGALAARTRAAYLTYTAIASRQRGAEAGHPPLPAGSTLAFVHSAFWRRTDVGDGEEQYLGPILHEIEARAGRERLALVGVGPRTNFKARRWWHAAVDTSPHGRVIPVETLATRGDIRPSLAVWRARREHARALVGSRDVRERALIDGCDLWPLVAFELEGVAWMQFPWSARTMDEAGAALDRLAPGVVVTYAEAGGWGRAIVLEARRRGIPSVGVQHGFIYRHWMNYLHGEDEFAPSPLNPDDTGFPAPTRTLLFDEFARAHLLHAGHFPDDRLVVTGSGGQDRLVARAAAATDEERAETRRRLGAAAGDRLLLVVSKHAQVRHAFPALVRAVEAVPQVRLVVKCHPAETPAPYERDAAGSSQVTIAPAASDLAALLSVSAGVVTVNSTVAVDAMRLGLPSLVVDLPNNLSPFVDAGVMLGAARAEEIPGALQRLLEGGTGLEAMREEQRRFLDRFGGPADGRAADRAANAILSLLQ